MTLEVLTDIFSKYGSIAIFVVVFLEYLNLPGFPAGIIMPLAGIMARQGRIHFLWVLFLSAVAAMLGSIALYGIGVFFGKAFFHYYSKKSHKHQEMFEGYVNWIREKGYFGIFLAKLIPVFRTIISIPAGFLKLNFLKFCIASVLGILIWNTAFIGAGYIYGDEIFEMIGKYLIK